MKIRLTPDLIQKIPGIRVGVLVIKNIKNVRKNSVVAGLLRGVTAEKKSEMAKEDRQEKITTHLRQTAVDNRVLAETHLLESMLRKAQQGKEIKSENNAQDIAHYLCLKYLTPALGRDLDQTEKDIEVGFITPKKGKKAQDFDFNPQTLHLVMWFVDIGTQDKEVFEKLPEEFAKAMTKYCGGTAEEMFMLNIDNPEADLNYVSERETQYAVELAQKAEDEARKAAENAEKKARAEEEKAQKQKKGTRAKTTPRPAEFTPTLKHELEVELSKAVKGLCETMGFCSKLFYEPVQVEKPKDKSHGDYATGVAFKLAKSINKTPREMVEMIQKNLPALPYIEKIEFAEPGFMNFTLSKTYLRSEIQKILELKEHYGSVNLGEGKKAMVEFSSPNIAKPLGVHHLLSTLLGQAIANIMEFCNYHVITANFLGDWGTQFGKLIYAFKNWGDRETVEKDPLNELLKLYVRFHDEAEKDVTLEDKGREEFKKLEEGDEQNRHLWQWIREESIKDLDRLYVKMGVHFQEYLPESLYEGKTKEIIEEGKAKNVFVEGEKGALVVKFENDEYPPYLIQKADGTTLYATRDIASIKDRIERFHTSKIIYVVDVAQSLHFKQLFATAQKLGLTESELIHVVFGRMSLPEGKMSTRKGTVILLDELIKEAVERADKVVTEKSLALTDAEKEFITEGVALGAIKYQVLSQNRETNLTFDWDRMLSLEGNTAPYLQYSYARAESILRKAREAAPASPVQEPAADGIHESQTDLFTLVAEKKGEIENGEPMDHNSERELARMLVKFPEVIEASAETYKPNLISNYLFELSQAFNSFYQDVQVLNTVKPELRESRLQLVGGFAQVLKNGLRLLGITVFEKM